MKIKHSYEAKFRSLIFKGSLKNFFVLLSLLFGHYSKLCLYADCVMDTWDKNDNMDILWGWYQCEEIFQSNHEKTTEFLSQGALRQQSVTMKIK